MGVMEVTSLKFFRNIIDGPLHIDRDQCQLEWKELHVREALLNLKSLRNGTTMQDLAENILSDTNIDIFPEIHVSKRLTCACVLQLTVNVAFIHKLKSDNTAQLT